MNTSRVKARAVWVRSSRPSAVLTAVRSRRYPPNPHNPPILLSLAVTETGRNRMGGLRGIGRINPARFEVLRWVASSYSALQLLFILPIPPSV